jgi:hypothetical protein
MRSQFFLQLKAWLTFLLLIIPALLLGWFLPGLFDGYSPGSGSRQKPMSAEAKFLWLVFVLLLVIGLIGWWIWHQMGTH